MVTHNCNSTPEDLTPSSVLQWYIYADKTPTHTHNINKNFKKCQLEDIFNPCTWKTEADGSLSSRSLVYKVSSRTSRPISQKNLVSKKLYIPVTLSVDVENVLLKFGLIHTDCQIAKVVLSRKNKARSICNLSNMALT